MVADHLWQSTLFLLAAALAARALRAHHAQIRHAIWLAASVKFLVPFAALAAVGRGIEWRPAGAATPQLPLVVEIIGQPFAHAQTAVMVAPVPAAGAGAGGALALAIVWAAGSAAVLLLWLVRWRRVAAAVREAVPVTEGRELTLLRRLERRLGVRRPVPLVSSAAPLEPGVFGILAPVLIWPRAIGRTLTEAQVEALLAHELWHVRRRDNLTAAVHMTVQAIFWFHPLVWWLGARLVHERELACDEAVVASGSTPETYAESILRTCEVAVAAPLVCVSGVSGSDLKVRIASILDGRRARRLGPIGRLLLAAAGALVVAVPIAAGALNAPTPRAQPAWQAAPPAPAQPATPAESFEVASVRPNKADDGRVTIGMQPGGRFTATNVPLRLLIRTAYQLQDFQVVGGPGWISSERFDAVAKAEGDLAPAPMLSGAPGRLQVMLQSLLAERFKLAAHRETREMPIYSLVLARDDGRLGPRLQKSEAECSPPGSSRGRGGPSAPPAAGDRLRCGMRFGPGQLTGGGLPLPQLAATLSQSVQRIVVDRTGLAGNFDYELTWTPDQMPQGPPPPGAPAPPSIDPNGPSIFTALQEQLGLKLEAERGPVEVLVVDAVERPEPD